MNIEIPLAVNTKGFLTPEEGEALYNLASKVAHLGPCLEIGSYCGKSTVYLGSSCLAQNNVLYAIDHHRGSEEQQPGEEYHDPDIFDTDTGLVDSFKIFRATMKAAGLEDTVVPVVSTSALAARYWTTPLAMVFIDGGHSFEAALCDYRCWAGHIVPGGILAIHDVFPDPADGGQAPYEILKLAIASGLFEELSMVGTLGVLRRL
jgi:predicted O-methyltransferase YrrM